MTEKGQQLSRNARGTCRQLVDAPVYKTISNILEMHCLRLTVHVATYKLFFILPLSLFVLTHVSDWSPAEDSSVSVGKLDADLLGLRLRLRRLPRPKITGTPNFNLQSWNPPHLEYVLKKKDEEGGGERTKCP